MNRLPVWGLSHFEGAGVAGKLCHKVRTGTELYDREKNGGSEEGFWSSVKKFQKTFDDEVRSVWMSHPCWLRCLGDSAGGSDEFKGS